jgi:hypothetical protein
VDIYKRRYEINIRHGYIENDEKYRAAFIAERFTRRENGNDLFVVTKTRGYFRDHEPSTVIDTIELIKTIGSIVDYYWPMYDSEYVIVKELDYTTPKEIRDKLKDQYGGDFVVGL